jgi:hypothetical protein
VTDVVAREPSIHAPVRPDLDVRIDQLWHRAKFATDPAVAERYWREHNELVAQRAALRAGEAA